MGKQITITQNDSGISLIFNLTEDNKPFDLSNKSCKSMIVFPDDTKQLVDFDILDSVNGKVEFTLDKTYTKLPGLYKMYIGVYSKEDRITAQRMVVYYVLDEYGGAN